MFVLDTSSLRAILMDGFTALGCGSAGGISYILCQDNGGFSVNRTVLERVLKPTNIH